MGFAFFGFWLRPGLASALLSHARNFVFSYPLSRFLFPLILPSLSRLVMLPGFLCSFVARSALFVHVWLPCLISIASHRRPSYPLCEGCSCDYMSNLIARAQTASYQSEHTNFVQVAQVLGPLVSHT